MMIDVYTVIGESKTDFALLNMRTKIIIIRNKDNFKRFNLYLDDKVINYKNKWFKVCRGSENDIYEDYGITITCPASTKDYLEFEDYITNFFNETHKKGIQLDKELWDCIKSLELDLKTVYLKTGEGIERETFNNFKKYFKKVLETGELKE